MSSLTTPVTDYKAALDTLSHQVEQLRATDEWQSWLRLTSAMHAYSPRNLLLILAQCPQATIVHGYRRWQELGRQVRKGEHGIKILAPAHFDVISTDPVSGEVTSRHANRFRLASVFDITQTMGEELPERPRPQPIAGVSDTGQLIEAHLLRYLAALQITVRGGHPSEMHGARGFWDAHTREIVLDAYTTGDDRTHTLIHEAAHALAGHRGGLDQLPRDYKETVAESVTYAVMWRFGLDASSYAIPYVAGWSDADPKLLTAAADAVQQLAHALCAAIDEPEAERSRPGDAGGTHAAA